MRLRYTGWVPQFLPALARAFKRAAYGAASNSRYQAAAVSFWLPGWC